MPRCHTVPPSIVCGGGCERWVRQWGARTNLPRAHRLRSLVVSGCRMRTASPDWTSCGGQFGFAIRYCDFSPPIDNCEHKNNSQQWAAQLDRFCAGKLRFRPVTVHRFFTFCAAASDSGRSWTGNADKRRMTVPCHHPLDKPSAAVRTECFLESHHQRHPWKPGSPRGRHGRHRRAGNR